ncbi:MAG: UDP-2,3-diacylglucosamine diphosphatase LpxI [Alphaproteobacteria bacterium]|nr:UDP-2,3-diacylglucosamine diphosphatase LpxI [Alphaproteobacteria bacterium]
MENSRRKLGIIAGGGDLPKQLIEYCQKIKRDFFVLAIEGNADKDLVNDEIPHLFLRLGQAGTGFKKMREEKVEEVVMIGTICRPSFKDLIPDLKTAAFFTKIGAKALGDDGLLRAVIKEIEGENMRVVGIHEVMDGLLVKEGVLGKKKPSSSDMIDIKRGIKVAYELGRLDVGQSVVVQEGIVLGVEGIEGTDELIKRCKNYKRKGSGGVLVKLRKPQQDMRIDLPTIGAKTLESAKTSGLNGLAVHAGNTLIVNEQEVIKTADKLGMFIIGINPGDYLEQDI